VLFVLVSKFLVSAGRLSRLGQVAFFGESHDWGFLLVRNAEVSPRGALCVPTYKLSVHVDCISMTSTIGKCHPCVLMSESTLHGTLGTL
jgi:hypothetical protein